MAAARFTHACSAAQGHREEGGGLGGPDYQLDSQILMRFAEAIENGRLPLVPQIQVGGAGAEKGVTNGLVEMMLSMLVADRPGQQRAPAAVPAPIEQH